MVLNVLKTTKKNKPFHTGKSSSGDSYGTGMKNPMGKIRDMYGVDGNSPMPQKGKMKPPKALA